MPCVSLHWIETGRFSSLSFLSPSESLVHLQLSQTMILPELISFRKWHSGHLSDSYPFNTAARFSDLSTGLVITRLPDTHCEQPDNHHWFGLCDLNRSSRCDRIKYIVLSYLMDGTHVLLPDQRLPDSFASRKVLVMSYQMVALEPLRPPAQVP